MSITLFFFFLFFLPFAVNPVEAPGNIQSGPPAKIQSSVYFCTNIHRGAQFQYQPEYYIFVGRFCCVDIVFFSSPPNFSFYDSLFELLVAFAVCILLRPLFFWHLPTNIMTAEGGKHVGARGAPSTSQNIEKKSSTKTGLPQLACIFFTLKKYAWPQSISIPR